MTLEDERAAWQAGYRAALAALASIRRQYSFATEAARRSFEGGVRSALWSATSHAAPPGRVEAALA